MLGDLITDITTSIKLQKFYKPKFIRCYIILFPFQKLEPVVHGRGRKTDTLDETYLGVYEELLYARKLNPVEGIFCACLTSSFLWVWMYDAKSILSLWVQCTYCALLSELKLTFCLVLNVIEILFIDICFKTKFYL
jgi:hypothetical protein